MRRNIYTDELYHYGTKGMKWGVRRYQNDDGSLTDKGKKRYARDAREKEYDKYDESTGTYYKTSKKNGRSDLQVDASRYVKEDLERSKNIIDSTNRITNEISNANRKSMERANRKYKEKNRMNLDNMSDQELRERINRELLERQYNDVFNPPKVSKGRQYATDFLDIAGPVLSVTSSALAIAIAVKQLRG